MRRTIIAVLAIASGVVVLEAQAVSRPFGTPSITANHDNTPAGVPRTPGSIAIRGLLGQAWLGNIVPDSTAGRRPVEDSARDLRKDRHIVHQDALRVRREEDRIAALERRVNRDRAALERDQKNGRSSHLDDDREALRQAQGALAAERGRLAELRSDQ